MRHPGMMLPRPNRCELISTANGVAIMPVLIALLLVRSPRWNLALLLVLAVLLFVSGSTVLPG
ncbi:hypothetical protein [uncultured Sphingomonas sp.]|uniref:hypothetical protein n=1 Tax=uncultured Sphingomonas sp. TaxID=158754 RepID=UPI0025F14169|nr:hypothetical protein [uncultured Sphingomonas sp.]